MFKINRNDFKILNKYKEFLNLLDDGLENVPRKDLFYKDYGRNLSMQLLANLIRVSYETDKEKIKSYGADIKTAISLLDFLIDRLVSKQYISVKMSERIIKPLIEVNKMQNGFINNYINEG